MPGLRNAELLAAMSPQSEQQQSGYSKDGVHTMYRVVCCCLYPHTRRLGQLMVMWSFHTPLLLLLSTLQQQQQHQQQLSQHGTAAEEKFST